MERCKRKRGQKGCIGQKCKSKSEEGRNWGKEERQRGTMRSVLDRETRKRG